MLTRRDLLTRASAAGAAALLPSAPLFAQPNRRPRIAAVYTSFFELSHAYHIIEAHMGPYLFNGRMTDPGVDVVSFYADQFPDKDMTREVTQRLNMPLFDSIAGALTLGGNALAVDGVLLIGEHGSYPKTELGIVKYPRKEFFDQIVAVMKRSNRFVPVFNDKHLSWRWDWAKEMYDTAKDLGFPLMAGSSVPLAQRIPPLDLPAGAELVEAVSTHGGPVESYDFHGLEVLQSLAEFRRGGETGVSRVEFLEGDALLKAADEGRWSRDLLQAALQAETTHRPGLTDSDRTRDAAPSHGILLTYKDGFRGTVLRITGGGERWNFACQVKGEAQPRATTFFPGPWGNRNLFRALSHAIQHMFVTGEVPYPVERTLLVSGILPASLESRRDGKPVDTPHLEFAYQPRDFTAMREMGDSWKIIQPDTPRPPRFEPGDEDTLKVINQ